MPDVQKMVHGSSESPMKLLHLLWLIHSAILSPASAFHSRPSWPLHPVHTSPHSYLSVGETFHRRISSRVSRSNIAHNTAILLSNGDNGSDEDRDSKHESAISNRKQNNNEEDNLLLPATTILSATAISASIGTLWSEYTVLMTGCGPRQLPDVVERSCYLGVLTMAGLSVFLRIVTSGNGLAATIQNSFEGNAKQDNIVFQQMKISEWMSLLAVAGAFVALGSQTVNQEQMDGLSGINIEMCRAIQQS